MKSQQKQQALFENYSFVPDGLFRAWMYNQHFKMNGVEYKIIGSSLKGIKFQSVPKDETPISEYDMTEQDFFSKISKMDLYTK